MQTYARVPSPPVPYAKAAFTLPPRQTVTGKRLDILRRRWTHYALWRFREYNELPHYFRRRCVTLLPHLPRSQAAPRHRDPAGGA